jgi:transcription-repair coupling factor
MARELRLNNPSLADAVEEVGLLSGFKMGESLCVPRRIRPAFLISLLLFRPVYLLEIQLNDFHFTQLHIKEERENITIRQGEELPLEELVQKLVSTGYLRQNTAHQAGTFSILGGILDIYPARGELENAVVRVDYFGDVIDSLTMVSPNNRKACGAIEEIEILAPEIEVDNQGRASAGAGATAELEAGALVVIIDPDQIDQELNDDFLQAVGVLRAHNITTISLTAFGNATKSVEVSDLELLNALSEALAGTELGEVLGVESPRSPRNKIPKREPLDVNSLEIGEYLVHDLHGIGRFIGRETKQSHFERDENGEPVLEEYLVIEYAPSSRRRNAEPDYLFVASSTPTSLAKYIGSDHPKLSRFGGVDFANVKAKTKQYTRDIARELIRLYATRINSPGIAFTVEEDALHQLEDSFEWELTPDQKTAIEAVRMDMEADYPMDRLICGDVGFGKTEIAIRAAFIAVNGGRQVAILVPTTILASQHYNTFTSRYAKFPINIGLLSRFTSTSDKRNILEGLETGTVDVVIGTHAILSKHVQFKNLGLVVIDEEQRFGTMQKETLKKIKVNLDVLSMSATPIPRTLEMALTGIRDISTLSTPPKNRTSIITNVMESSNKVLQEAIEFEVKRGGQVFLVHNNIATIQSRANKIADLIPGVRVAVAHAKMSEARIDRVIDEFWHGTIDVLVCTTIIETGLDIANANTLIVEDAEHYGLAQLHQLRGRVGRSSTQAYAFFFYRRGKTLTAQAYKRLETINDLTTLGAGTAVALKDLELRGSGNFLGAQQSGYIAGVGHEMYISMLSDTIETLKRQERGRGSSRRA